MRVLAAATSGVGHFNPLLPLLEGFARRGDRVFIVVPPTLAATVEATGHPFRIGALPPPGEVEPIRQRLGEASPAEAAVLMNREVFGRLSTAAMLPAMQAAFDEWRPDLVVRDPCEYASAVVAARRDVPHAQVGISPAEVEWSSLGLAEPALTAFDDRLVHQLRAAPYVTPFPPSLDPSPFADTRRFRAPAESPPARLPDWWPGLGGPLVYLTFGSVAGELPVGARAYRLALEAVDGLPARVLLTVGRAMDPGSLERVPDNVHVEAWVPQADVFAEAAAVVCHGGSGTTFGALAAGLALVFVPLFADQPVNARVVAGAGAGVVVGLDAGASELRDAIVMVLMDASYRRAAGRLAEEMAGMPELDALLDDLANPVLSN